MPKYVVYEIWTRSRVIEAANEAEAYTVGEPEPCEDLNLSNWHVQSLDIIDGVGTSQELVGGLNYRQVPD